LFVDLDGFKQVNDIWGHLAGDRVLQVIAERLRDSVRPTDLVARYGGDEFVVLAEGLHRHRDLQRLARRIEREARQPILIEGQKLILSASVGFARQNASLTSVEALIAEADRAMYRTKFLNRRMAASRYDAPALAGAGRPAIA
jgi:diguanylate cyclase (GGDEF)-like protein